jgi:hypothetical protein
VKLGITTLVTVPPQPVIEKVVFDKKVPPYKFHVLQHLVGVGVLVAVFVGNGLLAGVFVCVGVGVGVDMVSIFYKL